MYGELSLKVVNALFVLSYIKVFCRHVKIYPQNGRFYKIGGFLNTRHVPSDLVLYLCSLRLGQDTYPISAQTGHAEVAWGYFKPKAAAYKAREHKSTGKVNYMSSGINHKIVSLSLAVLRGDTISFGHRERTRKPRLVGGVRGAI